MKKIIAILCAVIATMGAVAQNSALFVYQKQGGLTPLMFSEVDSITFSCLDIDSIEYTLPVTQEIWTPDSIYRIPLSQIDSVSFQTPPTILKSHTIDLTQNPIRSYVMNASMTEMTVTLNASTPANLIPKTGDYLVAMEYGGVFGCGFVGHATSVKTTATGITITCEEADLTDAFECYYGVFQATGYNQEDPDMTKTAALEATRRNAAALAPGDDTEPPITHVSVFHLKPSRWFIPPTTLDITMLEDLESIFDDIDTRGSLESSETVKIESGLSIELAPVVTISHMAIVRGLQFYQRTSIVQNDVLTAEGRLIGRFGKSFEMSSSLNRVFPQIPLLYFVDVEAGGSFSVEASIGSQFHLRTESYRSEILERRNPMTIGHAIGENGINSAQLHYDVILEGSAKLELYVTPMAKFLHKNLASLQAKFYGGMELSGNFLFNRATYDSCEQSSLLYSSLKDKGWKLSPIGGFELTGQFLALSTKFIDYPIAPEEPWMSGLSVPNVDKITVTPKGEGVSEVAVTVSGNCITPHKIGLRVVKNEGEANESVQDWIEEDNRYWTSVDGAVYTHDFDLDINRKTDKIYPLVEYYGRMIVASPSWPTEPRSDIFYPYTAYMSQNRTRVISGASAIRDNRSESLIVQEGNFLPFTYFTPSTQSDN